MLVDDMTKLLYLVDWEVVANPLNPTVDHLVVEIEA